MPLIWNNRQIAFHTINTRTSDPAAYWQDFRTLVRMSDEAGFDGMLCFSANETMIDPWLAAHYLLQNSRALTPIVALNPVYMHPFTAAKMVSSFAYMYGRRTILNLIAGASLRDREVLHDPLDHDALYARLKEYVQVMQSLLTDARMTDFHGDYYHLSQAVLSPALPPALHPAFLVSGHSAVAGETADLVQAMRLRMLAPDLADGLPTAPPGGIGVHLGMVSRATEAAAWAAARARFPADPEREGLLDFMMESSDSVWKKKMYEATLAKGTHPEYWLEPFRQLRADCPWLVGSRQRIADILIGHIERGVDAIILDLPPDPAEFAEVAACLALVREAVPA